MNSQQSTKKQIQKQLWAWYDNNEEMEKEPELWFESKFDDIYPVKSLYHLMVNNLYYAAKETSRLKRFINTHKEHQDYISDFAELRDDSGSFEHMCVGSETNILNIFTDNTLIIGYSRGYHRYIIVQIGRETPKVYYGDIEEFEGQTSSCSVECYCVTHQYWDRNDVYGTTGSKDFEGFPSKYKLKGHKLYCTECKETFT